MTRTDAFDQGLVAGTAAELGWVARIVEPTEHDGEISADIVLEPRVPYCENDLYDKGIVFDLRALIDSVCRPGCHFIFNCTCGIHDCVGLDDGVHVAHPDTRHIVWELDIEGCAPVLQPDFGGSGFVRLIFDRAQYLRSVQSMLEEIKSLAAVPQPLECCDRQDQPGRVADYADRFDQVKVEGIQPAFDNDESLTTLLTVAPSLDWRARPMVSPGSRMAVGLFGDSTLAVEGDTAPDWLPRWFTRCSVARAWADWPVQWLSGPVEDGGFPPGSAHGWSRPADIEAKHFNRLGRRYAELLARSLQEGITAPGVEVTYRPSG
jgi:hypothetical protein